MEQFIALTGRNLKTYFRDKGAVFFSLLSMIIVICLMMFFLGDMSIDGVIGTLSESPERDAAEDAKNAELIVLTWTCAGILSINAVTVTLGNYSVMIKDRVSGKLNSIYTAPVSRTTIAASYITSAWLASVIICILTLFLTELYCTSKGMEWYSFQTHLQLTGMILVNSFAYAGLMYVLAILAKTEGAWSGLGTIIGTLVGFLGGIYIPIGGLSDSVGAMMKCTPVIYGTAMFRSIMTEDIIEKTFEGLPEELHTVYREEMGITLTVFDRSIGITEEWLLLLICGILFLSLGVCMLKYSKKTDR